MSYIPSPDPLRLDALPALRPERTEVARDFAGPVAQFRLRQVEGFDAGDLPRAPSISASPISTSPTTMGLRRVGRARLRRHSAGRLPWLRDELVISTKAGYDMWPGPYGEWGSRKYLLASLDQSLKRMGLDYVDIFYSHRFDPETPLEETMGALDHRRAPGQGALCRHFLLQFAPHPGGLGDPQAARHALPHPSAELLDAQSLDRGRRSARHAEAEGIGAIVFSPLAQGMLTDKYLSGVPADSRAAAAGSFNPELLTPANLEHVRHLDAIAKRRGQSLAQLALAWVLRDKRVTSALIGASRPEQVDRQRQGARQALLQGGGTARDRPLRGRRRGQHLGAVGRTRGLSHAPVVIAGGKGRRDHRGSTIEKRRRVRVDGSSNVDLVKYVGPMPVRSETIAAPALRRSPRQAWRRVDMVKGPQLDQ